MVSNFMNINEMQIRPPSRFLGLARTLQLPCLSSLHTWVCAVLCHLVLCFVVLCFVVLCCAVLCCAALHFAVLCFATCTCMPYCTVLCCAAQCVDCVVLHMVHWGAVWYCTALGYLITGFSPLSNPPPILLFLLSNCTRHLDILSTVTKFHVS